jgi:hypothetical protein
LDELTIDPGSPSGLVYDSKVIRGKNGRLFLDHDSNQALRQFTGEVLFTPEQLRDWRLVLENRVAWLQKLGIPYFFLVPPNAYLVYPEELPDGIDSGPDQPIKQLIRHLGESGSFARIVYPLEDILAAKPNQLLYPKTETHWSGLGAFIGYRRLADEIGSAVEMHRVPEEEVTFHHHSWMGELGYKVDPKEESTMVAAYVKQPAAQLEYDNLVMNRGMIVITDCPEAPPTTCLIFGDSFALAMLTVLAASFRRMIYAASPTLDYELVRKEKPDIVIGVQNERFLLTVPYDVGAPTVREQAAEKLARGLVRDKVPYWGV